MTIKEYFSFPGVCPDCRHGDPKPCRDCPLGGLSPVRVLADRESVREAYEKAQLLVSQAGACLLWEPSMRTALEEALDALKRILEALPPAPRQGRVAVIITANDVNDAAAAVNVAALTVSCWEFQYGQDAARAIGALKFIMATIYDVIR